LADVAVGGGAGVNGEAAEVAVLQKEKRSESVRKKARKGGRTEKNPARHWQPH
jgi:hypothetical protein